VVETRCSSPSRDLETGATRTGTSKRSRYAFDRVATMVCSLLFSPCASSNLNERNHHMPAVNLPAHKEGDYFVDYEEKVFEDVKAKPGEKALVTFPPVAFEGSIGLVNMLQATRLMRKGFDTSVLLYGPGVLLGVQRGFPKIASEAFPGHLVVNQKIG